jgi:hypothetical protein
MAKTSSTARPIFTKPHPRGIFMSRPHSSRLACGMNSFRGHRKEPTPWSFENVQVVRTSSAPNPNAARAAAWISPAIGSESSPSGWFWRRWLRGRFTNSGQNSSRSPCHHCSYGRSRAGAYRATKATGVPALIARPRRTASQLDIRKQPCEPVLPMLAGAGVPWMP